MVLGQLCFGFTGGLRSCQPCSFPCEPTLLLLPDPHDLQVRSQPLNVVPGASVSSPYRLPIRTSSQPVTPPPSWSAAVAIAATWSPCPPFLPQWLPPLSAALGASGPRGRLIPSSHHAFTAPASSVKPPGHSGSPAPSSGRQTPSL